MLVGWDCSETCEQTSRRPHKILKLTIFHGVFNFLHFKKCYFTWIESFHIFSISLNAAKSSSYILRWISLFCRLSIWNRHFNRIFVCVQFDIVTCVFFSSILITSTWLSRLVAAIKFAFSRKMGQNHSNANKTFFGQPHTDEKKQYFMPEQSFYRFFSSNKPPSKPHKKRLLLI